MISATHSQPQDPQKTKRAQQLPILLNPSALKTHNKSHSPNDPIYTSPPFIFHQTLFSLLPPPSQHTTPPPHPPPSSPPASHRTDPVSAPQAHGTHTNTNSRTSFLGLYPPSNQRCRSLSISGKECWGWRRRLLLVLGFGVVDIWGVCGLRGWVRVAGVGFLGGSGREVGREVGRVGEGGE